MMLRNQNKQSSFHVQAMELKVRELAWKSVFFCIDRHPSSEPFNVQRGRTLNSLSTRGTSQPAMLQSSRRKQSSRPRLRLASYLVGLDPRRVYCCR